MTLFTCFLETATFLNLIINHPFGVDDTRTPTKKHVTMLNPNPARYGIVCSTPRTSPYLFRLHHMRKPVRYQKNHDHEWCDFWASFKLHLTTQTNHPNLSTSAHLARRNSPYPIIIISSSLSLNPNFVQTSTNQPIQCLLQQPSSPKQCAP